VTGAIKAKLTLGGSGSQQQQHEIPLGAVKERAAEKAAEVYFEEKDRLARDCAEERVDRCVEGAPGRPARTAPARCDAVASVRVRGAPRRARCYVPRPCRPSVRAWADGIFIRIQRYSIAVWPGCSCNRTSCFSFNARF
jgi:hypothetical protein